MCVPENNLSLLCNHSALTRVGLDVVIQEYRKILTRPHSFARNPTKGRRQGMFLSV